MRTKETAETFRLAGLALAAAAVTAATGSRDDEGTGR